MDIEHKTRTEKLLARSIAEGNDKLTRRLAIRLFPQLTEEQIFAPEAPAASADEAQPAAVEKKDQEPEAAKVETADPAATAPPPSPVADDAEAKPRPWWLRAL